VVSLAELYSFHFLIQKRTFGVEGVTQTGPPFRSGVLSRRATGDRPRALAAGDERRRLVTIFSPV
jgi:hypothetical protein